jgi:asparagine synthase (glutamine-hydrolysing)
MRSLLEHRGPDDSGVWSSGGAALGATRLAIRGGASGHQPLRDEATGVVVVCNGEIDNHGELRRRLQERGREVAGDADIAVLPALYLERDAAFVEDLEGPFALAVWDPRSATLLLARDRAGERPLFYSRRGDEVVFATELSALATDAGFTGDIDREAIAYYLRFGSFAAPRCALTGVQKVGPAEIVRLGQEGTERRRYWRWAIGEAKGAGVQPSLDDFDRVFRAAVGRQTDCDVDYGLFLSGGVDSSLVAAVARALHPERPLRAYTLRFQEASYDEGSAAADVARHLDLVNEEVWVSPGDFPAKIRELVRMVGEPLADPAWVPTALLAQRAARDVKVVLVGEGGDEVFGGYPTYFGARLALAYGRLPAIVRRSFAGLVRRWPASDRKVTLSFLLKRFVDGDGMSPLARHLLWTSNIPPQLLAELGCEAAAGPPLDISVPAPGDDLLATLQRHDLENYLAEGLLTKADRASMAWALEPRAPFLDRQVMELAARLPPAARIRGVRTKVFLKRYAERYLPRSIVHRRKRGLSVPLSAWLRGPLQGWARDHLESGILSEAGIRTPAAVALLEQHLSRRADRARALWALLVLAEWLCWWDEAGGHHRESRA